MNHFIIYHTEDRNSKINLTLENGMIWLTQLQIAELFQTTKQTISKQIKNILEDGELDEKVVVNYQFTATNQSEIEDGLPKRKVASYNLDMILAIGYRVQSPRGIQFRKYASTVLKEYFIKGFAMDDERLKQGEGTFGKDYFRELLERVRSIRASERRIWLQITDIFAECSIDYDKEADITKDFYAMVQNKFHYAITGKTAAEIINTSADKTKEHMGLTTWKNAPDGRILKSDVTVAKNYLEEKQIRQLERAVTGYFDYIEDLIERENTFTMEEFAKSINEFLAFRKYDILKGKGSISKKQAEHKAKAEYDEFNKTQKIFSDFEKSLKKKQ